MKYIILSLAILFSQTTSIFADYSVKETPNYPNLIPVSFASEKILFMGPDYPAGRAFYLWSPGTEPEAIIQTASKGTIPIANPRGDVAGMYAVPGEPLEHVFIYKESEGLKDLGSPLEWKIQDGSKPIDWKKSIWNLAFINDAEQILLVTRLKNSDPQNDASYNYVLYSQGTYILLDLYKPKSIRNIQDYNQVLNLYHFFLNDYHIRGLTNDGKILAVLQINNGINNTWIAAKLDPTAQDFYLKLFDLRTHEDLLMSSNGSIVSGINPKCILKPNGELVNLNDLKMTVYGINDSLQIVGLMNGGMIYDNGKLISLNQKGFKIGSIRGISNGGKVIVQMLSSFSSPFGYAVLIPDTEESEDPSQ